MEQRWRRPRFLHLAELGVLGPNTNFVHMNLILDAEIDPIQRSGLTIVSYPRCPHDARHRDARAHPDARDYLATKDCMDTVPYPWAKSATVNVVGCCR